MPLFSVARSSDAQMGRLLPGEPIAVPSPMARTARTGPLAGLPGTVGRGQPREQERTLA